VTFDDGSAPARRDAAQEGAGPSLATLDIGGGAPWSVHHDLPVGPNTRALGRRVFVAWTFGDNATLLAAPAPARPWPRLARRIIGFAKRVFAGRRSPLNKWSPWTTANPLFDAEWYLNAYPQVATRRLPAFRHYDRFGYRMGLDPNPFFDTDWYLARYDDVRDAGENPLDHYASFGHSGAYDPGPFFSGSAYLDANPDVRGWGLNPLQHYIEWGRREGRSIYPSAPHRARQSIALPVIIGETGQPWFEIEFAEGVTVEDAKRVDVWCGARKVDLRLRAQEGRHVARGVLRATETARGLTDLTVVVSGDDSVAISALRTGWSSVRDAGAR
jgi:hypothetical protein